jgi:hypothetical protein
MNVHEFAPIRPLDEPPSGAPVTLDQRREALADAFRGIPLGRFDEELLGILADLLPNEVVARGLVSLIERRANAAKVDAWHARPAGAPTQPPVGPRPVLDVNTPPYVHGNSGPGYDA